MSRHLYGKDTYKWTDALYAGLFAFAVTELVFLENWKYDSIFKTRRYLQFKEDFHRHPQTSSYPNQRKTILVVGSGLMGLSTAYYLTKYCGQHKIIVIDSKKESGLGTSYQNGNQILPCSVTPFTGRSYWHFTKIMANRLPDHYLNKKIFFKDTGLLFSFFQYWAGFNSYQQKDAKEANMKLQIETQLEFAKLVEGDLKGVDIGLRGTFLDKETQEIGDLKRLVEDVLSGRRTDEVFEIQFDDEDQNKNLNFHSKEYYGEGDDEILLEKKAEKIANIPDLRKHYSHFPNFKYKFFVLQRCQVLHSKKFCIAMENLLKDKMVDFRFGTEVTRITDLGEGWKAFTSQGEEIEFDYVVLCTGPQTYGLMKKLLKIKVPIVPIKGYTFNVDFKIQEIKQRQILFSGADTISPYISLDEPDYSKGTITARISGFGDFEGFDTKINERRMNYLIELAEKLSNIKLKGRTKDHSCCLRPVLPDDIPLIGPLTTHSNIILNVGHGGSGNAKCLYSGKIAAESIAMMEKGEYSEYMEENRIFLPIRLGL